MKKVILSTAIAAGCLLPIHAFASGNSTTATAPSSTIEAGITPDSFLYPFDKMMESIQLWLASSDAEKAALLSQDANERLAEAKAMLDQSKDRLTADTLKQYEETLTKVDNTISSAVNSGENVTDVVKSINDSQKAVDSTTQYIFDHLKTKDRQQTISDIQDIRSGIQDTADAVNLVNSTTDQQAATEDSNQTQEPPLKDQLTQQALTTKIGSDNLTQALKAGLNLRQIIAIQSLADSSGKSFTDVLALFSENEKGIGAVAKALNIKPADALKTINAEFHNIKKEVQISFKNDQKKLKETDGNTAVPTTNQDTAQQASEPSIDPAVNSSTLVNSSETVQSKENEHKQAETNAVHQAIQNQTKKDQQIIAVTATENSRTNAESSSQSKMSKNVNSGNQGIGKGKEH